MEKKLITGSQFIQHIAPLIGLQQETIRRVVIDAEFRSVVMIYVEKVGDERMLQIETPSPESVKITMVEGDQ